MSKLSLDLTPFGTVSVGELASALDIYLPTLCVEFDFCNLVPSIDGERGLASYRGWYDHLAIGWRPVSPGGFVTADKLRTRLRKAIGETFMGYKGGAYVMDPATPVWVDNWGEYSNTAIVGLEVIDGAATIVTRRVSP